MAIQGFCPPSPPSHSPPSHSHSHSPYYLLLGRGSARLGRVKNIALDIEQNIKKSDKNYEYYLEQSNQSEEPFQLENVSEQEVLKTIKKWQIKAQRALMGYQIKS